MATLLGRSRTIWRSADYGRESARNLPRDSAVRKFWEQPAFSERARLPALRTIRRAPKHKKTPATRFRSMNRRYNSTNTPLKPEIAPENPQERFHFVPTRPFRDQFRKRPFGRTDRIRTCDPLEVFAYMMSLPTVSENPRIPLCLQGTGRFSASNCRPSFWVI